MQRPVVYLTCHSGRFAILVSGVFAAHGCSFADAARAFADGDFNAPGRAAKIAPERKSHVGLRINDKAL